MTGLDERRSEVLTRIGRLRKRYKELAVKISKYPPLPHDGVTEEEVRDRSEYATMPDLIASAGNEYSALILESSERSLASLKLDTKAVKWLTISLVVLTAVLAVSTVVDVLLRAGFP